MSLATTYKKIMIVTILNVFGKVGRFEKSKQVEQKNK